MKKLFLCILYLFITTISHCQILFSEDFDYNVGDALTSHNWIQSGSTATNPISVISPGLTMLGYPTVAGNASKLLTSGQDVYHSFTPTSSGDLYFSFMLNVQSAGTGDYFVALSKSTNQSNYYSRIYIKSNNAGYSIGLSKFNETTGGPLYSTSVLSFNTSYLIVCKYTFKSGSNTDDAINIFVLNSSSIPEIEPATPDIGPYLNAVADPADLGFITFRQGSTSSSPSLIIDGIRIAASWDALLGINQTVRYLDSINGNDLNTGENSTAELPGRGPKKTIENAFNSFPSGTTVYISSGSYDGGITLGNGYNKSMLFIITSASINKIVQIISGTFTVNIGSGKIKIVPQEDQTLKIDASQIIVKKGILDASQITTTTLPTVNIAVESDGEFITKGELTLNDLVNDGKFTSDSSLTINGISCGIGTTICNQLTMNGKLASGTISASSNLNFGASSSVDSLVTICVTGSGNSSITVPASGLSIGSLILDKSSSTNTVSLVGGNLQLKNILTFKNGLLITGEKAISLFVPKFGNGQGFDRSGIVGTNVSHIVGNISKKLFNDGSLNNSSEPRQVFPVGSITNYRPLALTFNPAFGSPTTPNTEIEVFYVNDSPMGSSGLPIVDGISSGKNIIRYASFYWSIKTIPANVQSSVAFDLELDLNSFTDFKNVGDLRIIRRDGNATDITNPWLLQATNSSYDNSLNSNSISIISRGCNSGLNSSGALFTLGLDTKDISLNVPLSTGWNILSIPVKAMSMSSTLLFPDYSSSTYLYNGGYSQIITLENAKGYWLKYKKDTTVAVSGEKVNALTIPVKTGWNLIGGYDWEASTSRITTTPGGIISSQFYEYKNGYIVPTKLVPGKGYWIKATADGVLNLPAANSSPNNVNAKIVGAEPTAQVERKEGLSISIIDAEGRSGEVLLQKETGNMAIYDLPPAPPKGIFEARWSSDRRIEKRGEGIKEIVISSAEYPVTLTVAGGDVRIKDNLGGTVVNQIVKKGESIRIAKKGIERITVEELEIPTEFRLLQNYPNPFNPETKIEYWLPEAGKITLTIYDVLGREVETLVDQVKEAGKYEVRWNASKYSSGVYFYNIINGNNHSVKKMLMLK